MAIRDSLQPLDNSLVVSHGFTWPFRDILAPLRPRVRSSQFVGLVSITAGGEFDLQSSVRSLRQSGPVGVWTARATAKTEPSVAGRICALCKTDQAIEMAHAKIRQTARRKGKQIQPDTPRFARYVIVFTTFPAGDFSGSAVLE